MNVTLSIDDETLRKARELADKRGTSLNAMIRDYLSELTAAQSPEATVEALERLWAEGGGNSGGHPWNREELYDRPVLR